MNVSVIIPTYNHASFLTRAIESVFKQGWHAWEVIIVDDGSTDATAQTISPFLSQQVHYIYQPNQGLAAARNTGIRAARYDLIALLDADDYWHSDFLARMVEAFVAHPDIGAAYCGFNYVDGTGTVVQSPAPKIVPVESFHETLVCQGNWLVAHGVVFRKEAAVRVGLFDETLRAGEDADLWLRMSAAHTFLGVPERLVYYRRHDFNMSRDFERMAEANWRIAEKLFGPPEADPATWSALKTCAYTRVFRQRVQHALLAGDISTAVTNLKQLHAVSPTSLQDPHVWRFLLSCSPPHPPHFASTRQPDETRALLIELFSQFGQDMKPARTHEKITQAAFLALAGSNSSVSLRKLLQHARRFPIAMTTRSYWAAVRRTLLPGTYAA